MERGVVGREHAGIELDCFPLVVYKLSAVSDVVFKFVHAVAHKDPLSALAQEVVYLRLFDALKGIYFVVRSRKYGCSGAFHVQVVQVLDQDFEAHDFAASLMKQVCRN